MNAHTPKWAPTLGVRISMDFQFFKEQLKGSKLIGFKIPYAIGKLLEFRCLKWAHMSHLSI